MKYNTYTVAPLPKSSAIVLLLCSLWIPLNAEPNGLDSPSDPVIIDYSTYRLGTSNDGNHHDSDDLLALPFEIAMCVEAGLKDKLTHIDYSNHIDGSKHGRAEQMHVNVTEAAERWGISPAIVFNCQEDLERAVQNIASQINMSSADNPFFLACAGPMEVAYRGVMASNPDSRKHAYFISHSEWNNEHTHKETMPHTWKDLQTSGVNCIQIPNQNRAGMRSALKNWEWLQTTDNKDWQWLWSIATRDERHRAFDASDAGIIWYVITGRGDEIGDSRKLEKLFKGQFESKVMISIDAHE